MPTYDETGEILSYLQELETRLVRTRNTFASLDAYYAKATPEVKAIIDMILPDGIVTYKAQTATLATILRNRIAKARSGIYTPPPQTP